MKNEKSGGIPLAKTCIALAVGAVIGMLVCVLILWLTAFCIVKSESVPYNAFAVIGIIAVCIGAFAGGFLTAKIRKSMGMLWGGVCAALIFAVLFCIGLIMGGNISGLSFLRLGLMLIVGALGGVMGVNGKKKLNRRKSFSR